MLLSQRKNDRFVDLLAATCAIPGKSIISNQQLIADMLFDASATVESSANRLVIPIRVAADGETVEVLPTTDYFKASAVAWTRLQTFLEECDDDMFR